MQSRNSKYCCDQDCTKCKCALHPFIIEKPLCKNHRPVGFTVVSMEKPRQAKCSKCISTSKKCTILMISSQKTDHGHCSDHQAFQSDLREEILCQDRLIRRSWFLVHHITGMRFHSQCNCRETISQQVDKKQMNRCKRNRKPCDRCI